MEYTAPDGHVMTSSPNGLVTYTCAQEGMTEGIFFSLETKSAATSIGIQQIQITRSISVDSITISIKESSSEELVQYQADVDGGATNDEIITNLFNNQ